MAFVRVDVAANTEALVVADSDGRRERVLTTRRRPRGFVSVFFAGSMTRPAWSPDNKVIALFGSNGEPARPQVEFVDAMTGVETIRAAQRGFVPQGLAWLGPAAVILSQPKELGSQVQLWRMSYPDGSMSPLTNDLNSYMGVDVSADRASVVTSRFESKISLWVGDADAAHGAEVVGPAALTTTIMSLTWGGDKVIYDSTANGTHAIVSVTPGTGEPTAITSQGTLPSATTDGKTIVFVDMDGLWKLEASAGARPVALVSGLALSPIVTPDNKNVVFLAQRSGVQSPWIVSIDGGQPTEIVKSFASLSGMDVSPDGKRILFMTSDAKNQFSYAVCDLPHCTNRISLNPSSASFVAARFMPDGRRLAYTDFLGTNIWIQSFDGGAPRQLTKFTDRTISGFAFSRDGKRLAIARSTTTNDIVLLKGLSK